MNRNEEQHGRYDPHRLIFHMCLVGVSICALGMTATLYAFFQELGWGISRLHVDALGDYLLSPLAFLYNVCLLLGGACFILAMYGLYLVKFDKFTMLLSLTGAICGISIMSLGIFPFNDQPMHHYAVIAFIYTSLLMFCTLFIYRFQRPQLCPLPLGIVSLIGLLSCILVLWEIDPGRETTMCEQDGICSLALLMWVHTLMTMLTGIGLALMARRMIKIPKSG